MKKNKWYWTLALCLILLSACSPQSVAPQNEPDAPEAATAEDDEAPALQTVPTPTTSTESEAPKGESDMAEKDDSEALIIYRRSGGFAGVEEEWRIYADGRIEGPEGSQQGDPAQVQALLAQMTTSDFNSLADSYVPLDNCCDRFTYAITLQLEDGTKTVQTTDDIPDQPEQLTQILDSLNNLLLPTQ